MFSDRKNKKPNNRKSFLLSGDQIQSLVSRKLGGCIATDKITKDGLRVGFMYRTAPQNDMDSGWHFLSRYEDEEYMNTPENHAIYAVNTIANYDRSIIPHLDTPANCAYEKAQNGHKFIQVFDFEFPA